MRISTHVNVYFAIAGTARQRHKPTWNERAILYNIILVEEQHMDT